MELLKYLIVPYGNNPLTAQPEQVGYTTQPTPNSGNTKEVTDLLASYLSHHPETSPRPESHHSQESYQTAHEQGRQSQEPTFGSFIPSCLPLVGTSKSPPQYILSHSALAQNRQDSSRSSSKPDTLVASATGQHVLKTICHCWYHRGMCSQDPASPNYSGSGKICRYLHQIDDGMADFKVSRVARHMHKHPCGLERCPQNDGMPSIRRALQAPASADDASLRSPIKGSTRRRKRGFNKDGKGDNKTFTQLSNTAPTQQAYKRPSPTVPAMTARTKSSKKKANKKRKREQSDSLVALSLAAPSKPPSCRGAANETCFFWYHGMCQRGTQCNLLHALAEPPTLVQPPPGFVHFHGPCGLRLCPGDHVWVEDEKRAKKRHRPNDDHKSRIAEFANLPDGERKVLVKGDSPEDGQIDENGADWFLAGFPDVI